MLLLLLTGAGVSLEPLVRRARPEVPLGQIPALCELLWTERDQLCDTIVRGVMDDDEAVRALTAALSLLEQRPRSSTTRAFSEHDVVLCEPLRTQTDSVLFSGARGTAPLILKKLSEAELTGYQLVADRVDSEDIACAQHLAPFQLFTANSPPASPPKLPTVPGAGGASTSGDATAAIASAGIIPAGKAIHRTPLKARPHRAPAVGIAAASSASSPSSPAAASPAAAAPFPVAGRLRNWCSMPRFPVTLEQLGRPFPVESVAKLLLQLSTALRLLHAAGLAHMDVKPSNIFVSTSGDLMLGDFGNVRVIGGKGTTTTAYVPQERKKRRKDELYDVSATHDWWMLAMAVADMMAGPDARQAGVGAVDATCAQLRDSLNGAPNLPMELQSLLSQI
jgi:hypothetical protein